MAKDVHRNLWKSKKVIHETLKSKFFKNPSQSMFDEHNKIIQKR